MSFRTSDLLPENSSNNMLIMVMTMRWLIITMPLIQITILPRSIILGFCSTTGPRFSSSLQAGKAWPQILQIYKII
jgi:hypothetical protein